MKKIKIASKMIGPDHEPFIIAEMSGNHNQSLEQALKIVKAAAEAGAHALKIQTYTPDTMTLNCDRADFIVNEKNQLWKGKTLYQLYEEAYTPWEWHEPIFALSKQLGMIPFSTPFDESSLEFLESLDVPCYKIASFENTDIPLIRKVAAKRKPMIISTGMATVGELDELVKVIREEGCEDIILLKCTSSYPATPENSNLYSIPHLQKTFNTQIGLSDHTLGIGVAVASVALGATVIEKHFTLDRSQGGVDAAFSLEPHEFSGLVKETKNAWQALGTIFIGPTKAEKKSLQFRRSIYVSKDLQVGQELSADNIRIIRPGYGLEPKYYDLLIGRKIRKAMKMGTPLTWDDLL